MKKFNNKPIIDLIAGLYFCLVLSVTAACASQPEMVQGILQEIDLDSRSLIIQNTDGNLKSLVLDKSATVQANTGNISLESLEPGLSVQIEALEKTVKSVNVSLAQVDATVLKVEGGQIILQPLGSGQQIVLNVRPFTIVRQDDSASVRDSITSGRVAKAYYNPVSMTVYEIQEMPAGYSTEKEPDISRVEGLVWGLRAGKLLVNAEGGAQLSITVDNSTKIMFEDKSPASAQDLERWVWVKVYYSPVTWIARQIEVRSTP